MPPTPRWTSWSALSGGNTSYAQEARQRTVNRVEAIGSAVSGGLGYLADRGAGGALADAGGAVGGFLNKLFVEGSTDAWTSVGSGTFQVLAAVATANVTALGDRQRSSARHSERSPGSGQRRATYRNGAAREPARHGSKRGFAGPPCEQECVPRPG